MARRQRPSTDQATQAAWEDMCYWSAVHHEFARDGELHCFAPRIFFPPTAKRRGYHEVPDYKNQEAIATQIWRGVHDAHCYRERLHYIMAAIYREVTTLEWVEEQYERITKKRIPKRNSKPQQEQASNLMSAITKHMQDNTMSNPYPSSPSHPPKIGIKVTRLDDKRHWHFAWREIYASRRQLDFLIAERPVKWIDDNTLIIADTIKVSTDAPPTGLSEIMEHEFTEQQRRWTPHASDLRELLLIWMSPEAPLSSYVDGHVTSANLDEQRSQAKVAKLQEKADKKKDRALKAELKSLADPKTPRPAKAKKIDGLIHVSELLSDTDIDAKEARTALRKMNATKPDHGWSWPKAEADKMKPLILAQVKKMRK